MTAQFRSVRWMLLAVFALASIQGVAQQHQKTLENGAAAAQILSEAPASHGQAGPSEPADSIPEDQQQLRGLDEQVQEIKSDVLSIAEELNRLEERLLYPSGTQVAIFVALAEGAPMRLDAVRLQIDGQLVAHYIYSAQELEALRKGGVQRLYVGNVARGDHQLDVLVDGKLEGGSEFNRTDQFTFRKEIEPKLVELRLAGDSPITLGEW